MDEDQGSLFVIPTAISNTVRDNLAMFCQLMICKGLSDFDLIKFTRAEMLAKLICGTVNWQSASVQATARIEELAIPWREKQITIEDLKRERALIIYRETIALLKRTNSCAELAAILEDRSLTPGDNTELLGAPKDCPHPESILLEVVALLAKAYRLCRLAGGNESKEAKAISTFARLVFPARWDKFLSVLNDSDTRLVQFGDDKVEANERNGYGIGELYRWNALKLVRSARDKLKETHPKYAEVVNWVDKELDVE